MEQSSSSSDTDSPDSSNLPRSRSSEAVMINVPVLKGSEVTKENGDKSSEPEKELSINKIDLEENPSADKVKVLTKEHSFTIEVKLKMSGEENGKISAEELKMSGEDSTKICAESEVAKSVPEKQSEDSSVQDNEPTSKDLGNIISDSMNSENESESSPSRKSMEFEKQRQEIIELWNACNVPLVHRTYFFLLFKGDPTDSVYMEVELRRLSYLKNAFSLGDKIVKDGQILSQAASLSTLNRERTMLSKLLLKKFPSKERDNLYEKWGIGLKTKRRRLQLCNQLWKDTKDMDHIGGSAAIIAKLVGFEAQNEVPKEMFELNFSPGPKNIRSFSWTRKGLM